MCVWKATKKDCDKDWWTNLLLRSFQGKYQMLKCLSHAWKLSWYILIDCEWQVLKIWAEKHWKAIQLLQQKVIYHRSCSSREALESSLSNKLKYNHKGTVTDSGISNAMVGHCTNWLRPPNPLSPYLPTCYEYLFPNLRPGGWKYKVYTIPLILSVKFFKGP